MHPGSINLARIPRESVLEEDMTEVAKDFRSRLRQVLEEKFEEPSDLEFMAIMVVSVVVLSV